MRRGWAGSGSGIGRRATAATSSVTLQQPKEKLLKLVLDVGGLPPAPSSDANQSTVSTSTPPPAESSHRTVFSGIKKAYRPEQLVGKRVLYLANLKVPLLNPA
ncbi:hypothetical protein HMI54_012322 [Coelomomyces lativittatus]|nr:hypothetical protein HMI54_012322 [Coelomomyces lativittatus]